MNVVSVLRDKRARIQEMRETFRQTHHTRSTVGEHARRVAEKSLAVSHTLEKLHIRTDIPAADKVAAVEDFIRGSSVKHADLKTTVRRIMKRI